MTPLYSEIPGLSVVYNFSSPTGIYTVHPEKNTLAFHLFGPIPARTKSGFLIVNLGI